MRCLLSVKVFVFRSWGGQFSGKGSSWTLGIDGQAQLQLLLAPCSTPIITRSSCSNLLTCRSFTSTSRLLAITQSTSKFQTYQTPSPYNQILLAFNRSKSDRTRTSKVYTSTPTRRLVESRGRKVEPDAPKIFETDLHRLAAGRLTKGVYTYTILYLEERTDRQLEAEVLYHLVSLF